MSALFPAPALCQRDDEDILIEIAAIIFPDFIQRNYSMNGLRLQVDGDYRDQSLVKIATDKFQLLLGVLRAWRPGAGQRADEIRPGVGAGAIRDEHGNQAIFPGSVIAHTRFGSEVETYARAAKVALGCSVNIRNALWLLGQRDLTAADFFMIYECAEKDLAGPEGIKACLSISRKKQQRFTASAHHLALTEGGRHAKQNRTVKWALAQQRTFITVLVRKWIEYRAR